MSERLSRATVPRRVGAAAAVLLLVLARCTGDDGDADPDRRAETTAPADTQTPGDLRQRAATVGGLGG